MKVVGLGFRTWVFSGSKALRLQPPLGQRLILGSVAVWSVRREILSLSCLFQPGGTHPSVNWVAVEKRMLSYIWMCCN